MKLLIITSVLSALSMPALAETDSLSTMDTTGLEPTMVEQANVMETTAISQGESNVINKISNDFSGFLGDSSQETVSGLRNGEEFTITTSSVDADGVIVTETATINPPTGEQGHGNVFISLGLAENQLTQLGITDPTALDIGSSLLGGEVTLSNGEIVEVQGVLQLRSEGLGWGQIAKVYGTKLGPVISAVKSGRPIPVTSQTDTTTSTTQTQSSTPVTTRTAKARNASFKQTSRGSASAKVQGKGHANGRSFGQGIVSAGGNSLSAGPVSHGNGQAKIHVNHGGGNASSAVTSSFGSGIVSGGGNSIGGGSSNAGGNRGGKGHGRFK